MPASISGGPIDIHTLLLVTTMSKQKNTSRRSARRRGTSSHGCFNPASTTEHAIELDVTGTTQSSGSHIHIPVQSYFSPYAMTIHVPAGFNLPESRQLISNVLGSSRIVNTSSRPDSIIIASGEVFPKSYSTKLTKKTVSEGIGSIRNEEDTFIGQLGGPEAGLHAIVPADFPDDHTPDVPDANALEVLSALEEGAGIPEWRKAVAIIREETVASEDKTQEVIRTLADCKACSERG